MARLMVNNTGLRVNNINNKWWLLVPVLVLVSPVLLAVFLLLTAVFAIPAIILIAAFSSCFKASPTQSKFSFSEDQPVEIIEQGDQNDQLAQGESDAEENVEVPADADTVVATAESGDEENSDEEEENVEVPVRRAAARRAVVRGDTMRSESEEEEPDDDRLYSQLREVWALKERAMDGECPPEASESECEALERKWELSSVAFNNHSFQKNARELLETFRRGKLRGMRHESVGEIIANKDFLRLWLTVALERRLYWPSERNYIESAYNNDFPDPVFWFHKTMSRSETRMFSALILNASETSHIPLERCRMLYFGGDVVKKNLPLAVLLYNICEYMYQGLGTYLEHHKRDSLLQAKADHEEENIGDTLNDIDMPGVLILLAECFAEGKYGCAQDFALAHKCVERLQDVIDEHPEEYRNYTFLIRKLLDENPKFKSFVLNEVSKSMDKRVAFLIEKVGFSMHSSKPRASADPTFLVDRGDTGCFRGVF